MEHQQTLAVVVLAAGKGTRMKSALPKVLHEVAGKAMVQHVVDAASSLNTDNTVVVYGHGGDQVKATVSASNLQWAEQAEQLGTGHAVAQAMPAVKEDIVLILYGDVPLIRPETLREFVECVDDKTLALMTLTLDDPSGYGRIVRDGQNNVQRIVEQKDATENELGIQEINTGILACTRAFLDDCHNMTITKQNNRYTVTAKSGYGRISCSSEHLQHAMATVFNIVKGLQA